MRARNLASPRARLACLVGLLGLMCGCATAGTGDDSIGVDSGGRPQQGQGDAAADATMGGGDSSPSSADSSPVVDSGMLGKTDSGSAADSGGPTTDSGSTDTGTAVDSATGDTGTTPPGDSGHAGDASDSSTAPDTSTPDTSMPLTCQPGSVAGFTASNVASLNSNGACTGSQVNSLVAACFDPAATNATCMTWQTNNPSCFDNCTLFSSYSATNVTPGMSPPPPPMGPWGPFISVFNPGESDFLNLGACVSLADPTQKSCGNALTQAFECEYDVCASNCSIPASPADPTAAETAYDACTTAADGCPASGNGPCTGVCGAYVNTINSACGNTALTGPASFCLDGSLGSTSGATADPSLEKLIKQQCVN